jgi:5'-nucleotidase
MRTPTLLALAVAAFSLAGCSMFTPRPTEPVPVKILAINDFHGNLKPPQGGIRIKDPADPSKTINVPAGGSEHLATAVKELRARNPNHIFVAAGDLIGATPLLSALFRDEPTIESLGLMGLEVTAVGNHEFDKGTSELLRMQRGGCNPTEGCKGPQAFKGASFQYLAASTVEEKTGKTLFPPYMVKKFQGIPVAFIGLTLKATPTIVVPTGVVGLRFRDEAETVNELVPELRKQGVEAIVLLIHEGGIPSGDYNECPGISGPIVDIVKKLDKAVDVVVSGHTHRAYNCRIDGRLVTSGDKYGTIVSQIDLMLDPKTGDVTNAVADNVIVRTDRFTKDPVQTELIAAYEKLSVSLAKRVVGRLAGALPREASPAGESPLGQVIADAQLARCATKICSCRSPSTTTW